MSFTSYRIHTLITLLLISFSSFAEEPWVIYGQTIVGGYGIDNPSPNKAGLIGEVKALPYVVPEGKRLRIDGVGMESHTTSVENRPVYVLIPWVTDFPIVGTPEIRKAGAIMSCTSSDHTVTCPTRVYVPAGKVLNLRIICQSQAMFTTLMGWYIYGSLEDL